MRLIEQYIQEYLQKDEERRVYANTLRNTFVEDYPIQSLNSILLEDYVLAKEGYGNEKSFCRRIRYELEPVAHMGNVWPDVFGIYLKNGTQLTLSKTLQNKFGDDFDAAFSYIKEEMVLMLLAVENDDYQAIENCGLNRSLKYKLLIIYYPEKFVPVCTQSTLDEYCIRIDMSFDNKEEMAYRNMRLVQWKNTNERINTWDNFTLMRFCDWLWRSNQRIEESFEDNEKCIEIVEKVEDEIEQLQLDGESKEAFVKVRINQNIFRKRLLKRYNKCCLCAVDQEEFLIASHIKPWGVSEAREKLDADNGFMLCPNHDQLFDKGWITFADNGNIIISDRLSSNNRTFLNVGNEMSIKLTEKNKEYLKYHRKNIFLGSKCK